jgi:hypothetical protein
MEEALAAKSTRWSPISNWSSRPSTTTQLVLCPVHLHQGLLAQCGTHWASRLSKPCSTHHLSKEVADWYRLTHQLLSLSTHTVSLFPSVNMPLAQMDPIHCMPWGPVIGLARTLRRLQTVIPGTRPPQDGLHNTLGPVFQYTVMPCG